MVHGERSKNYDLAIRFLGAGVNYTESQVSAARKLDPYFFQGASSKDDVFLCFSFLETPGDHAAPSADHETMYRCQVMTSWPYRKGFFGRVEPTEVPTTGAARLSWMKTLSADWQEPFRSLVHNLPSDCELKPVELADWMPQRNEQMVLDGRVVLVGDAQHCMVMYRGEGANHAIVDVSKLMDLLKPIYQSSKTSHELDQAFRNLQERYELEVVERTQLAVLASRHACMDAHDFKRLNDKSPPVRRRLMMADLEELQDS